MTALSGDDYRIAGKFGELSAIRQTELVLKINNLLADLLIRQTFFRQMPEASQFAKFSPAKFSRYMILLLLLLSKTHQG